MCDFLDEAFEPAMLTYHETSHTYMKQRAAHRFNRTATEPVSPEKADSWRTALTSVQVAEIEWICHREMNTFGYVPDGVPLPFSRRAKGWLKIAYWHLQNWRHRHAPQFILQDRILQRSRTRIRKQFQRTTSAASVPQ